jgi:tetratricopeptide (TPR) repeat protein
MKATRLSALNARRIFDGLILVGLVSACSSTSETPVVERVSTTELDVPDIRTLVVDITLPPAPGGRRATERVGLALALLELGLTEIPGVVPRMGETPVSLGLQDVLWETAEIWTAGIEITVDPWEIQWSLCDEEGECALSRSSAGSPTKPAAAVGEVLDAVATQTGRAPHPDLHQRWVEDLATEDDYTVLVAGRAGASFYGLLPPIPEQDWGNSQRDPVAKARLLDPTLAPIAWLASRRALAGAKDRTALPLLENARAARPGSPVLDADLAAAHALAGRYGAAQRAWQAIDDAYPAEPRFHMPSARAALMAGDPKVGLTHVIDLPERDQRTHDVALLRVALADALHSGGQDLDAVLAGWQATDPNNPEPVQRRIRLRIALQDYAGALGMVSLLRDRATMDEADKLEVALLASLGRFNDAADIADSRGDEQTAVRLRARANDTPAHLLTDPHPAAVRWLARDAFEWGDYTSALTLSDAALRTDQHNTASLRMRADALRRLDRVPQAQAAQLTADRAERYSVTVAVSTEPDKTP